MFVEGLWKQSRTQAMGSTDTCSTCSLAARSLELQVQSQHGAPQTRAVDSRTASHTWQGQQIRWPDTPM